VRDEANQITTYEASLPLNEMPTLRPASRSARDMAVRFSWILHNDEGRALQWSRANEVFPWWQNTGSFLPAQHVSLAAQVPLGFTQMGAVDEGSALPVTLPSTPPRWCALQRDLHDTPPRATALFGSRCRRASAAVNAPSENILPPAPVRNEPLPQLPPSPP
jgi:hypothetical protein